MSRNKKSRGILGILLTLIVIGGIGFFAFQFFFASIPSLDQNKIDQVFKDDQDYCYYYEKLDEEEKITYKTLLYGLSEYSDKIPLIDVDINQIQKVLEMLIYDHPELYYVNNQFQYQDMKQYITFIPQYDYSQEQVEKINNQIEKNTEKIITQATKEKDFLAKAKMIYDCVIVNNEYQENAKTDQNIISSLIEKKTVCAGYARAYQYIMNRSGEQCAYIVGTANQNNAQTKTGDGHAWTMVKKDNDYYYCDPTWGDRDEKGYAHTCYGYFMMSSQEMLSCYTPEKAYEKTKQQKDNYYKEKSCYMTSYSKKVLSNAIKQGLQNKTRVAEVKCASQNVYTTVKNKLDSTYLGYEVLSENGCYSTKAKYTCNDNLLLIEIYY